MISLMRLCKIRFTLLIIAITVECTLGGQVSHAQVSVSPANEHSDQWFEGKLQGILDFNSYLHSSDIDVTVQGGLIILKGSVPSKSEREFAVKVSEKLGGTLKVVDNIKVNGRLTARNPNDLEQYVHDRAIEAKVKILLSAFKLTHDEKFQPEVKNSVVVLKGGTLDEETRIRAGKVAASVHGVKEVRNLIKLAEPEEEDNEPKEAGEIEPEYVQPVVNDGWISDKVRSLLQYSSTFSGSDVLVASRNGSVELRGRCKNIEQKTELLNNVRDIFGVNDVSSSLEIRASF